jgi:hypothetical protein
MPHTKALDGVACASPGEAGFVVGAGLVGWAAPGFAAGAAVGAIVGAGVGVAYAARAWF